MPTDFHLTPFPNVGTQSGLLAVLIEDCRTAHTHAALIPTVHQGGVYVLSHG